MMDYEGFWTGFVVLFALLPMAVGAALGVIWAWRREKRGWRLMAPALLCGIAFTLCVFAGAVFTFSA